MTEKIKIDGCVDDRFLKIDLIKLLSCLPEEQVKMLLESLTFNEIIPYIESQIKRETQLSSWDTKGNRDGALIRDYIIKIQGLESEFREDMDSKLRAVLRDAEHYKKFYDWYFKVYHYNYELHAKLVKVCGDPTTLGTV